MVFQLDWLVKRFPVKHIGPSGKYSRFSRLTNTPHECGFVENCGSVGLYVYLSIVIRASKGIFGYYLSWIGIVYIHRM